MPHQMLGASLRLDTAAFVPGKYPTLRVETEDGLPLLIVGGRTVVEIFAPSVVCRLGADGLVLLTTRHRLAQVRRLAHARAPWPNNPNTFLAAALEAIEYATGPRLSRALTAIQDRVRCYLLAKGCADVIETGATLDLYPSGGIVKWYDVPARPGLQFECEIEDSRLPALCADLRLPTSSGILTRIQKIRIPKIALTAHERLRLANPEPFDRVIDDLLAEVSTVSRRRSRPTP